MAWQTSWILLRFRAFIATIRDKLIDNVASAIAAAIIALGSTAAILAWNPLQYAISEKVSASKNISITEALRIARATVGASTVLAIPFRNADDPNQFIAVWYQNNNYDGACDSDKGSPPAWCALSWGPVDLDILVGGHASFERKATHITAGTAFTGDDWTNASEDAGRSRLRSWGIVDWDGDGKKEVLSIANSTGTSATHPIFVSLFETSTDQVRQLRYFPSRFSSQTKFINISSGPLRAWLIARLSEFLDSSGDVCNRDRSGVLSCQSSDREKQHERGVYESQDLPDPAFEWMHENETDWIANNGVDFTRGQIHLAWSQGLFVGDNECVGRTGHFEWYNVFKGPLVVNDLAMKRKAVAYLQDGDHHREIPAIIYGKRYVWLGLAVRRQILAIDSATFELRRFEVPQFAKGIPDRRADPGDLPATFPEEESGGTKDFQLDGLGLGTGHLTFNGVALTLKVPSDEFENATQCIEAE